MDSITAVADPISKETREIEWLPQRDGVAITAETRIRTKIRGEKCMGFVLNPES